MNEIIFVIDLGFKLTLKSCTGKKSERSKLKSPPQVKIFLKFALRFSTFHDSFKLVQRAFRSGSITLFKINLVRN